MTTAHGDSEGNEHNTRSPNFVLGATEKGGFDGGCSWVVCIAGFFIQFIVIAQWNISGLIFMALLDEYNNTSRGQTAGVTALAIGVSDGFGMIPAILGNRFGFANIIMIGGVTCAVGLFTSSFAPNIFVLYLTYGLVWGSGSCLSYLSALFLLPHFFRARIGLANGIVFFGAPVGTLALTPFVAYLLPSVGLARTFQILAGLQLVVVFCGFVIRLAPPPSKSDQLRIKNNGKGGFDWTIFTNKGYMAFVGALCLFMPVYLVPYVHLVRLALDSGVESFKAALLINFTAFGSLIVRPFFGKLMDTRRVNCLTALQITLLLKSVSTTLVPIATNYEWYATYAFLYGFLEGCFVISLPLIVQDLVEESNQAFALGTLYCFRSIPMTAGPLIAGWIYDVTLSYDVAFFSAGVVTTLSTCLMFLVPLLKNKSYPKQREIVQLIRNSEPCHEENIAAKETCL